MSDTSWCAADRGDRVATAGNEDDADGLGDAVRSLSGRAEVTEGHRDCVQAVIGQVLT
ncbi:hypothetical protein AB0L63_06670 [Nocardia sp. NPDC051990]|uniref:hypothetical protein n=1 Tax=Nocardia sp. NPDC051990 TaxID=3155285 RepID=UPI00342A8AE1